MRHQRGYGRLVILLFGIGGLVKAAEYPEPLRCLMEASDTIELSSPVEGIIAAIEVERGDRVQKGQVVARLDSRIEEIALELARARAENVSAIRAKEARLKFLVSQARRNERLAKRKTVSQAEREEALQKAEVARQELRAARVDRETAKLEAKRARALLEQKVLRSPINGIVVERPMSVGEYVAGNTTVVTLAKVDPLFVEAIAPISYYAHVKVGDKVVIHPEEPVGGSYEARVSVIDQVLDAASGTFGFRIELSNPDGALPAGLRCTVTFPDAETD
ncbi:MAG: efflux RND transporter periplasmic adaptor subunit [Gammaproteobacteria bacterium]|nr:MAG: efflux RND transporter periplasmic adaptor subunit [Gammaproteobacteria bacterium]